MRLCAAFQLFQRKSEQHVIITTIAVAPSAEAAIKRVATVSVDILGKVSFSFTVQQIEFELFEIGERSLLGFSRAVIFRIARFY